MIYYKNTQMQGRQCFKCGKSLEKSYIIIPYDIPYINIYLHNDCELSEEELELILEKEFKKTIK